MALDLTQIAERLGVDPEQLRFVPASAQVSELTDDEAAPIAEILTAAHSTAATDPLFGKDGKPRLMKITTWMAHGGYPNRNFDGFTAEDLKAAVENGLATAEAPMVLDWNHDFTPIGVWTKAEYRFNPNAVYGEQEGHYGVLLEGVIFAWRYPEQVDRLTAEQSRNGRIDVSMACIGSHYEPAVASDGTKYTLIREPVFFACSVLTERPADPNSVGLGSEDPTETAEDRQALLLASDSSESPVIASWVVDLEAALRAATAEEEINMNEMEQRLLELVRAAVSDVLTEEGLERLPTMLEAAQRVPDLEGAVATANAQLAEANERLAEMETAATESELRVATLEEQLSAANEELAGFRSAQAEREAAEAAEAALQLREARLAALPEIVRARLEGMEEEKRERLVTRWVGQDEEEWDLTLASLSVRTEQAPDYVARSEEEGTMSTAADEPVEGQYAFYKHVK